MEQDSDFTLHRLYLANIKAPKITQDEAEDYGWESKESLRKLAIGKKVRVEIEFTRVVNLKRGGEMNMVFATCFLLKNDKNLAAVQVERGLARNNLSKD